MGFMPGYTRSTTLVVAASDSRGRANADYVCDGTDDQVEINNAIAALGTVRGAVILLEGTFNITASINLASNVALVGQGAGTVLRIPNGHDANLNVILGSGIDNVLVANLKIDGNEVAQAFGNMYGIYFSTVTRSTIARCWVENLRHFGIYILASSNNNTITGNNVQFSRTNGIELNASSNNTITGNNVQSNISVGIRLWNSSNNNTVTGNNVQANGGGIDLGLASNNTITGNIVHSNGTYGIYLDSSSNNNTVTGNNVQSNGLNGIAIRHSSNNNTIVGNTVSGNSQTADNTYDGIRIDNDSDYNNVQGNTVRHAGGANQHRYGIRINNANCDGNFVHGNDLYNAGRTADYSDAGTGTIYHNNRTTVGWVP